MADHLTRLYQSLFEEKLSATDFCRRLRSDASLKLGLETFYLILKRGVDDDDDSNDKHLRSWTDVQIHSVLSLGLRIVSTIRSLPGEFSLFSF